MQRKDRIFTLLSAARNKPGRNTILFTRNSIGSFSCGRTIDNPQQTPRSRVYQLIPCCDSQPRSNARPACFQSIQKFISEITYHIDLQGSYQLRTNVLLIDHVCVPALVPASQRWPIPLELITIITIQVNHTYNYCRFLIPSSCET